jgi:hypothetical protein
MEKPKQKDASMKSKQTRQMAQGSSMRWMRKDQRGYSRLGAGLGAAGLASGFSASHFDEVELMWVKLEKLVMEMGCSGR